MSTLSKKKSNGNGGLLPNLLDDFFGHRFFSPSLLDFGNEAMSRGFKTPPANITETKTEFILELSAPGLKREDFNVEINDGILTISSEKKEESKEEKEGYTRREFSYNSFQRSFQLPDNVIEESINAKYDNGLLKVSIPKKENTKTESKKSIKVD
jgi:HSP20 family protein